MSWSAKIQPKLKKLWKTIKIEQKIVKETLFSEGFSNFIQFGLNLSAPTRQSGHQFGLLDFMTTQAPLGAYLKELVQVGSSVFWEFDTSKKIKLLGRTTFKNGLK